MVTGPLRRVLAAIEGGAGSQNEIAQATGLARDVVAASVDHLLRLGRLEAHRLSSGCPGGSCAACVAGTPSGSNACEPAEGGPGLLALIGGRTPKP